jgi:[acyl-carrier-protein] S-malonyltransferase
VIGNASARTLDTVDDVRAELIRQVTSPVLWVDSVRAAAAWSPDIWVDTGPGKVVAGLASRIVPGLDSVCLSALVDAEEIS